MVNLIGLVIGNQLARDAQVPNEEIPRFSLLGAASPSPLLGAVLVNIALAQRETEQDSGGMEQVIAANPARLVRTLRERLERQQQREREQEQTRQRELSREQREYEQRQEQAVFERIMLAVAELQQSMARPQPETPTFDDAMSGVQDALNQLRQIHDYQQRREGNEGQAAQQ